MSHERRYIFVTGGVTSALGKGIACASIGRMLKNRKFKVSIIKLDPYLNVDPGTMRPTEHGEVFVTSDGAETDLDLGHYERFLNQDMTKLSNLTAGQVYRQLLDREREGSEDGYLGQTVQVVPHFVEAVEDRIIELGRVESSDFVIVEVGGTVGDIEAEAFIEAVRSMRQKLGAGRTFSLHLTFVPMLRPTDELKTKPTQHSVRQLRGLGIQPDAVLCRLNDPIESDDAERVLTDMKSKVSGQCGVAQDAIVYLPTLENVYAVPRWLESEGLADVMLRTLDMEPVKAKVSKKWQWIATWGDNKATEKSNEQVDGIDTQRGTSDAKVEIAIVGKYTELHDSYLSVSEAIYHSAHHLGADVNLTWIKTADIERDGADQHLDALHGIVVPGGFGVDGMDGMIQTARFARENQIPYFGLCLGLQIMVIEFARNVAGITGATSQEFDPHAADQVINLMPAQQGVRDKGGTMRLRTHPCEMNGGTTALAAFAGSDPDHRGSVTPLIIRERHRHRYEYNNDYRPTLEPLGLISSGINPDLGLVEIAEVADHPFMLGTQFHPEFKSRPAKPHPLFKEFVRKAMECTPLNAQASLIANPATVGGSQH